MKNDAMIMIIFLLVMLSIVLSSVALNKNISLTPDQIVTLDIISNNINITSTGCLSAKCFTDDFIPSHQANDVFFSTSEGIVTCQSINTQQINVGDNLLLTPLTLSLSNNLVLSSNGIVSSNLFQIEASMSVLETFQVGEFTTTERLALLPQDGTIVYDSTIGVVSVYQSGAWFLLSAASGIVSISSSTLAITGTNTDPIIDLIPSGIVAGSYQAPTITFNTYGMATNVSANTVVLGITSTTLTLGGTSSNPSINLTPSGISSGSYQFPTVTFNQYGIATSAVSNTVVLGITSTTLSITGTVSNPVLNLTSSGITPNSYQFPTVTFNQYGIATSAVSNTVVLGISSTTLTLGGTSSNPVINLTPAGIVANSYTLATVTFDQYGIAQNAVSNTLSGTANQINVSSFPNSVVSLNSSFINSVNGKVDRSGDTMTGQLNSSFAGSASSPNFAINSSNGIFQSTTNHLNLATNGANRLDIDNTGKISITSLSTGVVHSDVNGLLTSSLVTNAEIATQTPLSNPDSIVTRDLSGNFAANMITLSGSTINGTDVATKNYVDTAVSLGLSVKQPVVAVSVVSITSPPSGAHTFDSIVLGNGDRALLVAQAIGEEKYNGAWVVNTSGAWTRPTDFNTGNTAGAAYFLVQMGTNYSGSSWVCSTPMAVIGTDALVFAQFSSPQSATGQNDAVGDGLVYNNSIGSTLHFRTLLNDVNGYLTMTNLTNSVQLAINATSANTANTIVARDASRNFSANNVSLTTGLIVSTGSAGSPSIQVGPVSTGLSSASGNLQLSTAFGTGISIASVTGVVTIPNLTTIGIVHNSASGVLSTSLIVNADVDPSAAIVDTKLATISTTGKVSNTATTASSSLGINTIVLRDGSNNFVAGTITATLNGNATSATNFSGSLAGDVTGTQSATVVSFVGGVTSANVATGATLANAATNLNTFSTIVKRDGTGNFNATTITANLTGNASGNLLLTGGTLTGVLTTTAGTAALPALLIGGSTCGFSFVGSALQISLGNTLALSLGTTLGLGVLHSTSGSVVTSSPIVNADIAAGAVTDAKITGPLTTAGLVSNTATTATSALGINTIVSRDGSNNFAAGTITANLSGNATTATTATSFSGSLVGDVTGTQSATVVSFVGGVTAANVASGATLANGATNANTASTIVKRDAGGNFTAGTITANLTGNVTGSASLNLLLTGGNMTGPVDSATALDLGTVNATSVNISKVGVVTTINGSPVSLGKYASTSSLSLANMPGVQNIIQTGVGSLVYAANSTFTGTVIRFRISGSINNNSPNTIAVVININGSSAVAFPSWAPGTVSNAVFILEGILSIRATDAAADLNITLNPSGGTTLTGQKNASTPTWNKTIANTLSATMQFSASPTTGTIFNSIFETLF
jgi:hypothetical protein